ncbi:aldehyde dehydrogenase (NADP(+)) [Paraburkholderia agricolaris]|uniref:Aldehyde dehydrogenase (NADP(+)) n=1 Tax=Paraburkholderia agricolaris TaxID=2152888 RepID=A0ABW9A1S0_9BURK
MLITGEMLIGARAVRGGVAVLRAFDPARGVEIEPAFGGGDRADVALACSLAGNAFDAFRNAPLATRARFLEAIADNILEMGDVLIERANTETGLPKTRIEGERGRTVGQLRLFAALVREGRWLGATLDSSLPDRKPLARPDLRLQKIPVGPVAVFGASNFPLAFSVAGGDTVSAFAAGCPVVVKAHGAHPGTSELVGRAIQRAVIDNGLPEGVFSLLFGAGNEMGEVLVAHPEIKAVGFTGSRRGGLALVDIASKRREPIPVFAEMSSINPFFVLPGALDKRSDEMASALADSIALGVGQFCTNPGLVILLDSPQARTFVESLSVALAKKEEQTMLTPGISAAYRSAIERRSGTRGVEDLAQGVQTGVSCPARPALFATTATDFLASAELEEEIFGPTSLVITCADEAELIGVAEHVEGQLTATLQLEPQDYDLARRLLPTLERKAGRILANGFPTGVEVSHAMVHGGPFPATSDSRSTSVGAGAIERFLRPVCYQDLPVALLPEPLHDDNPLGLWRLRNGKFSLA